MSVSHCPWGEENKEVGRTECPSHSSVRWKCESVLHFCQRCVSSAQQEAEILTRTVVALTPQQNFLLKTIYCVPDSHTI